MAGLSRATSVVFVALLFFHHASEGFQVPRSRSVLKRPAFTRFERSRLTASSLPISDDDVLASSIVKPGPHIKVYGRTLSLVGFYFLFVTFGSAILMYPVLTAAWLWSLCFDRTQRKAVDWVVHVWAKLSMLACFSWPRVTGLENLGLGKEAGGLGGKGEAFLLVPNHTSFMDIYALSGFLPMRLKYVSKIEILRVPLIGWAMRMAKHVAIRRTNRTSQMKTFKDTVDSLVAGSSVVTFAEGTRSPDGTLKNFKKGPFKMAPKAGVRIVPVSISGLYRFMPPSAILPLAFPGRSIEIKVHPPVETEGRSQEDVLLEVFQAVNSGLPPHQRTKLTAMTLPPKNMTLPPKNASV
mmetsp:Transcript_91614/g.182518  ORF Transcript_91614/g.182518 Transcript_91614/m.182518 type:complete len:352 (-) Transcript_91614:89-1144(-)